jgi:homoserine dehydrogenase
MNTPLRIGIAGLGTVGAGTLKIAQEHAQMLAERAGRPIVVVGISARDKKKNRGVDTSKITWYDNPVELANAPDIDLVVETIGGADGAAYNVVETALKNGKSVVTANKALIAHHGVELAKIAEKSGALLAFEAAVAGGIPIIKALRDGLAANQFARIMGILNGTCNYILTHMWDDKRGFDDVLKEAQAKGYAEAEPSFDVDGIDTAHKLAILASLAYGIAPAIDKVHMEGIRRVTLTDMQFADELGFVIKLLGITSLTDAGIELRVHPYMLPKASPIGAVSGVFNAVLVEGDQVGSVLFTGRGAGAGPTASSVIADIIDIARGVAYKPFTLPVASLKTATFAPMASLKSSYYIRLGVIDKPGVLADATAIFKQEQISLRSVIQHSHKPGEVVQLVVTTHLTEEAAMLRALAAIEKIGSVKEKPYMIRMEAL